MSAETNLQKLLAAMRPVVKPQVYVFATVSPGDFEEHQLKPLGWFHEPQGITIILEESSAISARLDYAFPSNMITLTVHSSLEAIGFLAVITERLAKARISVNVISAFFHDHLFVPIEKADQAMGILTQIMEEALGSYNLESS